MYWMVVRTSAVVAMLALCGCGRMGFDGVGLGGDDAVEPDGGSQPDGTGGTLLVAPIVNWSFDGTGQNILDSSGNGVNGVLGTTTAVEASDPVWVTTSARICSGTGLTFDGTDDIVTIPGPSQANLSAFSISFSLHATGAGGGQLPRILSKESTVSDVIIHYRPADNAIAINMFNTSNTLFATFASGVVLGQRANWVVSFDDAGDRRVHVYKDGTEATYVRQDPMTGALRTTTNPWTIGNQSSGIRAFDGTLDAFRIYDTKLDASEILALSALCPP